MKTSKLIALILMIALLCGLFSFSVSAQEPDSNETTSGDESGYTGIVVNMDPMQGFQLNTGFGILEGFTTTAKAAALYDLNSHSLIYSKEIDKQIFPASLTKLMTCLIAVDYLDMDDPITASATAIQAVTEWDRTGIQIGETMPFYDLLHYVLLESANEGCNVIAEAVSGTIPDFIELMNARAKELGCTNTNFMNAHGLHDDQHYTSVRDLIIISEAFLANEELKEICYKINYEVPATNLHPPTFVRTTNMLTSTYETMRYFYEPARGVKTGNTNQAGRNLISTAEHNGMNLLVVVTGCPTTVDDMDEFVLHNFTEAKSLFEYGDKYFQFATAFSAKTPVGEVPVTGGTQESVFLVPSVDESIVLPIDYSTSDITTDIQLKTGQALQAPLSSEDVVGTASVYYQGTLLGTVDVKPFTNVPERTTDSVSTEVQKNKVKVSFGFILLIITGLTLVYYIGSYIYLNINRKKRRREAAAGHRRTVKKHSLLVTILENLLRKLKR